MQGMLVVAMLLAFAVMLAALAAEGRGQHFLRVVLGLTPRRGADHMYDEIARDGDNWDVVASLEETQESRSDLGVLTR
jgi:hypothetical protein